MDCYDCNDWKKGSEDGTCIHYINNTCPYGYHDEEKEFHQELIMEQQEQM